MPKKTKAVLKCKIWCLGRTTPHPWWATCFVRFSLCILIGPQLFGSYPELLLTKVVTRKYENRVLKKIFSCFQYNTLTSMYPTWSGLCLGSYTHSVWSISTCKSPVSVWLILGIVLYIYAATRKAQKLPLHTLLDCNAQRV